MLAAEHLDREYREYGEHRATAGSPRPGSSVLLSYLLAALVLRVLPETPTPSTPPVAGGGSAEVFRAYRGAVGEHFTRWHQVADYGRALGYDTRTLTRATRAATGTGAKAFLDQRILLEAKRLLAHADLPVGRCAHRLGFRDVGNFTAFFRRQTGQAPTAWAAGLPSRR